MTSNRFGGGWTVEKLAILNEYLGFYTSVLKTQPNPHRPFKLVYIDAFAGTGRCGVRGPKESVPGSASIALDTAHPFSAYHFIEPKKGHLAELRQTVAQHSLAGRCHVHAAKVADALPGILNRYDWRSHRGVLFLDPFGLQCDWALLEQVRKTEALDVFFLLNLSGLFRNAAIDSQGIDSAKADALTRVFGTPTWRERLYTRQQDDLFSDPQISRDRGWNQILEFSTERLRTLFPLVLAPRLLHMPKGPPLFAIYLAVSNPAGAARKLAANVGTHILSKLR